MHQNSFQVLTITNTKSQRPDKEESQYLDEFQYQLMQKIHRSRSELPYERPYESTTILNNSPFGYNNNIIVSHGLWRNCVEVIENVDEGEVGQLGEQREELGLGQRDRNGGMLDSKHSRTTSAGVSSQRNDVWRNYGIRKDKKKNPSDYKKNICGYITKKIIRELTSSNYNQKVKQLCFQNSCNYVDLKSFYVSKIEQITGPSHLPNLFIPQNDTEIMIKKTFRQFFQWFLKERYLRYLLLEGKMADKKAYIQYKNNVLLFLVKNVQLNNGKNKEVSRLERFDNVMVEPKTSVIFVPTVKWGHTVQLRTV